MMYRFFILILFSALLLAGCKKQAESKEETETSGNEYYAVLSDQQINSGSVKLDRFKSTDFTEAIESSGNIEIPPSSKYKVSPIFPGIIKGIDLMVGQRIEKGQYLFSVENADLITLQQDFASIGEQLSYLKNDYERQLALYRENVNSEKKYLKAESDYKSQLANYNGMKRKLQLIGINIAEVLKGEYKSSYKVSAPIAGIVSDIEKVNGTYAPATEPVLMLVNNQEAHLSLNVFENDVPKIRKGQDVVFRTSDGKVHKASVHLVSPVIDPETKAVEVHADINGRIMYSDQTYVTAKIITGIVKKNAFPINALLSEGDENFIIVLDKKENAQNYFVKYPVKVSIKDEYNFSFAEIEKLKDKLVITDGGIMLQKEE